MLPIKATDLIPEFAKSMGIDEQDARNMVAGYYSKVKSNLSNMVHQNQDIPQLGLMRLRHNKVGYAIEGLQKIINNPNYVLPKGDKKKQVEMMLKVWEAQNEEYAKRRSERLRRR